MTETEVQDMIEKSLWEYEAIKNCDIFKNIRTFAEEGVINVGLIIALKDGTRYATFIVEMPNE